MDARTERTIGQTAVTVTALGLGGAPLSHPSVDPAVAAETVRAALALGVRLLDTAPLYGQGESERRFGQALAGVPRGSFALATKVGRWLPADVPVSDGQLPFDYSEDGVRRTVEASLTRLGLDWVDILHVHDPDAHEQVALDSAFRALRRLKEQGICRAIGAGMNQAAMLTRFVRAGVVDCVLAAGRYTLLDQIGLRELLPACQERGVGVIIGGPYNSGILATGARPGATFNYTAAPPDLLDRTARIEAVCNRHGVPLRAAALQFPLAHPAVVSVIPGARSVAEAEDNARLIDWPIPAACWQELRAERLVDAAAPLPVDA